MPDGFKIADAYVDVVAEVRRQELDASARAAGTRAGGIIGDGVSKGTGQRLRDSRGKFASAGGGMGDDIGGGLIKSMSGQGARLAGTMRGLLTSPYVLGAAAAAGAVVAPALMAGIAGGVLLGAGAGVIGLGYAIVKEESAVKKASERLGKTVTTIFKKAAKPMVRPFAQSFGLIEGMMKRLEPSFNRMFASMAPAIVPLTKGFTALVENAMPGLMKMIEAAGPFMIAIAPALGDLGTGISIFAREIAKAGPDAALFFTDLIRWTGGIIAGLGYMIGWVARGYGEMRKFFTSIPGWTVTAYNAVKGFVTGVGNWFAAIPGRLAGFGAWFAALPGRFAGWLGGIWTAIAAWWGRVGGWFAALPGRVGSFLAALPGVLRNAFTTAMHAALFAVGFAIGTIIKHFQGLPGRARAAVATLWGAISGAFNSARAGATNTVRSLVDNARNYLGALPGRARAAVSSLWGSISGAFNSARSGAQSTTTSMVNNVRNYLGALPGRARSAVSGLWGSMVGAFNSARSGASSIASSIVNGAVSILRGLPGRARDAVSGLRGAIMGAASGAGGWLVGAGHAIIAGLASGIRSAVGGAVSAAVGAMRSVVAGAKSALGISSPSKVFDREVGRWLLPGAIRGVKKTVPAARKAMGVAARTLVPDVSRLQGVGGYAAGSGGRLAMGAGQTIHIGNVTLDASGMRDIQDVINLVAGISTTARSHRARVATAPGR